MKGTGLKAGNVQKITIGILILFSVIASVTKIFTGFDIDEAYALAIPYRVLQGDRLFADMWEVHQTSFLLPYLFLKLWQVIAGSMDGVVLYTRIVTTFLHLAVSLIVYFCLRKRDTGGKWVAAVCALIYYNFLPKWMINMDFSMQQLWFFTLFLVCLFRASDAERRKRTGWLFAAGLMLALDVLAYPGMVIVYPVAVLLLLFGVEKNRRWKDILSLTGGCFAAAVVFFLCIFSYMTPGELLEAVPHIFMDGSHQYDLATKLGLYASQWGEAFVQALILLVPSALCALAVKWIYQRTGLEKKYGKLPFGLLLCLVFEILVSALITFAGLFVTWGPFRLQVRYIVQFVMAFCLWKTLPAATKTATEPEAEKAAGQGAEQEAAAAVAVNCEARQAAGQAGMARRQIMWALALSLAAFLGILLASNVGPVSSSSYLVIGNMVFVGLTLAAAKKCGRGMRMLADVGAVLFLLSLMMCKGYYMRNTEYVPGDISEPLAEIEQGPLAGVYVPEEDFDRYTDDYETIQSHTTGEDRVLFMGTEGLCNLYANGKIVIPTTISTPAFNEQWVEYFTLYPEKQPTVIFLAKNTVDDRHKFFVKNEFGIWIAERYDVECMEETDSLCILRLRENPAQ